MRWTILLLLATLLIGPGCDKHPARNETFTTMGSKIGAGAAPEPNAPADEAGQKGAQFVPANAPAQPEPEKKDKPRKIRYTAEMKLVVEKLDVAEEALDAARKEAKAEFAKAETSTMNSMRSGVWRVRIPPENLQAFRTAVAKIGEVERNTLDSEDLTAQYYDLEAHIKNRKDARETLRELLKETGKKDMKHYIEVWDKLELMTDEINRKEGQLKLWANLTELTTMTVHMREKQPYDPAKIEDKVVPTFGARASSTWYKSWEKLIAFGEGMLIFAIALTPWLPVLLIVCTGIWFVARRLARASTPTVVVAPAASVEPKKA